MANYYNIVNHKFGMVIHLANTFSEELNMNIEYIDLLGMYSCIKERYFLYLENSQEVSTNNNFTLIIINRPQNNC